MGRRKQETGTGTPVLPDTSATEIPVQVDLPGAVPQDTEPTRAAGQRFTLPLMPDGSVDLNTCRSVTRDKLKAILTDSRLRKELGIGESARPTFPPALIGMLYNVLGEAESLIAVKLGVPIPASSVLRYTPQEIQMLTPSTAKVLNKHASQWMVEHAEECELLTALVFVHIQKFHAFRDAVRMVSAAPAKPVKERPNGAPQGPAVPDLPDAS